MVEVDTLPDPIKELPIGFERYAVGQLTIDQLSAGVRDLQICARSVKNFLLAPEVCAAWIRLTLALVAEHHPDLESRTVARWFSVALFEMVAREWTRQLPLILGPDRLASA